METLNAKDIKCFCDKFGSRYEDHELVHVFSFNDFVSVRMFLNTINGIIEIEDHHPTITYNYSSITVTTTTHDAVNKVTKRDTGLLSLIVQCYKRI